MASMLNVFYFIIFCSINYGKSEKHQEQGNYTFDQKSQSPINIPCECNKETCTRTIKTEFPALTLENLNSSTNIKITNTGHTLMSMQSQSASIRGGPLKNIYNFAQLHFHWGCSDHVGSEHQIDSKKFPMEGHFVFSRSYQKNTSPEMKDRTQEINSTKTCNVEAETVKRTESGNQWDKSGEHSEADLSSVQTVTVNAVLGVLFVISENGVTYDLLEKARDVVNVNSAVEVSGDYISQFVSLLNLDSYFTYSGSLTTPPYSSNVIWIVLQEPLSVSSKQLALLRKLESGEHGPITKNFRDIQGLYDRVVCSSQSGINSECKL